LDSEVNFMKKCVLYDRACIECGECNMCDLEPGKICNNCMRCVDTGADYNEVIIKDIVDGVENALPVEPAVDAKAVREAWQKLRESGLWNGGGEGEEG